MPRPLKTRTEDWQGCGFVDVNGKSLMLADSSEKSIFIAAPSRSGKMTDLISWGALTNVGQAMFLNDPKLEIFAICAAQWRRLGKRIFKIAPFKIDLPNCTEDLRTDFLNPLTFGPAPNEPGAIDYLYALAEAMIYHDGGSSFFTDNFRRFLIGAMAWAQTLDDPKLCNLIAVLEAVSATGDTLKAYCQLMTDCGVDLARDAAAPYMVDEPNTGDLESLSTGRAQLQFLAIPEIKHAITNGNSFTQADFKEPDFVASVGLPEEPAKRHNRFTRLIFASGFSACLRPPRAKTLVILDELGTCFGPGQTLSQVETVANLGAGYGCRMIAVYQNLPQMISVHGKEKAESILSGAGTQIFLTPNDEVTAGYISRRAGQRTTFDLEYDGWYWQPNGRGCGVPVYRPHDLYGFPRNKLIMFREGVSNAIEAYRAPYHESALAKLAAPNPYAPPLKKAVPR